MHDTYLKFKAEGIDAGVWSDYSSFPHAVVVPRQTHTCNVGVIEAGDAAPGDFADTDALVCLRAGLRIGVRTADCVPLLLYAPDIRAVAAVHAGWRGTLGGIVDRTLDVLEARGADMRRVLAGFGPSVCGGCYEVSPELATRFVDAGFGGCVRGARHVGLEEVNLRRLVSRGVPEANVSRSVACTLETPALPSWRREPGTEVRLLTHICLL